MCLGLEPGAEGLKAQTNPLRYGSTPSLFLFIYSNVSSFKRMVEYADYLHKRLCSTKTHLKTFAYIYISD